jgi:hypothetical protein
MLVWKELLIQGLEDDVLDKANYHNYEQQSKHFVNPALPSGSKQHRTNTTVVVNHLCNDNVCPRDSH